MGEGDPEWFFGGGHRVAHRDARLSDYWSFAGICGEGGDDHGDPEDDDEEHEPLDGSFGMLRRFGAGDAADDGGDESDDEHGADPDWCGFVGARFEGAVGAHDRVGGGEPDEDDDDGGEIAEDDGEYVVEHWSPP